MAKKIIVIPTMQHKELLYMHIPICYHMIAEKLEDGGRKTKKLNYGKNMKNTLRRPAEAQQDHVEFCRRNRK